MGQPCVAVEIGQLRQDPDSRYALPLVRGRPRVVEVTAVAGDGKATVKDTSTLRSSRVSVKTLEKWAVVERPAGGG